MTISLAGQTIIVTGGAKRLGRAVALECAKVGADVVISYKTSDREAELTLAELRAMAPAQKFAAFELDVTDGEAVCNFTNRVFDEFENVRGLVNCAAIFKRTPFESMIEDDFDTHIGANLKGPFLLGKSFGDRFLKQGAEQDRSASIVNFADIYGSRPLANYIPYCISKAGVIMLTQALAKALAPHVRVNCIAPGSIYMPDEDEAELEKNVSLLNRIPFGRMGTPDEIAETVVFLLGGPLFIVGAILPVDGGQILR